MICLFHFIFGAYKKGAARYFFLFFSSLQKTKGMNFSGSSSRHRVPISSRDKEDGTKP
jgi:hypothetical protein